MAMINIIAITITTMMTIAMANMKTPRPWQQHNEYDDEMSVANVKASVMVTSGCILSFSSYLISMSILSNPSTHLIISFYLWLWLSQ